MKGRRIIRFGEEYELVGMTEDGEQILRDIDNCLWVAESDGHLRPRKAEPVASIESASGIRTERASLSESEYGSQVQRGMRQVYRG